MKICNQYNKLINEAIDEVSSYLNLHGDDPYDIEQVTQDNRHKYERVDGILYELSGHDEIADIDDVHPTDENTFYEDQIQRYMEYLERPDAIIQTFPVQKNMLCSNLECMLEYLEDGDKGFEMMHEILNPLHMKLYDMNLSDILMSPEEYGFNDYDVDFTKIRNTGDLMDVYNESNDGYDEEIYNGLVAIIEHFDYEVEYTLTDFNHRFEALKRLGKKKVMVDV